MKIAITGGTGFVGRALVSTLLDLNHQVVLFTRQPERAAAQFPGVQLVDYYTPWSEHLGGCTGVVNLAGEPIAEGRWTPQRRRLILESRQLGTAKLVAALTQADPTPPVLVSASAVGYYGTSESATYDETSPPGGDFLAQVCQAWEAAAQAPATTRVVVLRLGIVLGPGGALGKMVPVFRAFAGGPIGSGQQWVSWIHRQDVVRLILRALEDSQWSGVYNATAPEPVTMSTLSHALGEVMHRPVWLPVPALALQLLLGEGAQLVLEGQRVLPRRPLASGFTYTYPSLTPALEEVLGSGA